MSMRNKSRQESMEWDHEMFESNLIDGNVEWDSFGTPATAPLTVNSRSNDIHDSNRKSKTNRNDDINATDKETTSNSKREKETTKKSTRKNKEENLTSRSRSPNDEHREENKKSSSARSHSSRSPSVSRRAERTRSSRCDDNKESDHEQIEQKSQKKKHNAARTAATSSDKHSGKVGRSAAPNSDSDSDPDPEGNRLLSNGKIASKLSNDEKKKESVNTIDNASRRHDRKSSSVSRGSERGNTNQPSKSKRETGVRQNSPVLSRNERTTRKEENELDPKKSKPGKVERKTRNHEDESNVDDKSVRRDVSTRKSRTSYSEDKLVGSGSSHVRDSSRVRQRRSQINAEQLSQSRQRAVQRAEARSSWRESQRGDTSRDQKIKTASTGTSDDDLLDARRNNILDQSRRGPIRSFRVDDDDDDDDFSIFSSISSTSFTVDDSIDAPFVKKNIRQTASGSLSSYLPSGLNSSNKGDSDIFHKQERRPSAFGTGHDRVKAIHSIKSELEQDTSDEESCASYALPNGLSRSNGIHFEIDRSSKAGVSARRPSMNTNLVIPCINGVNDTCSDMTSNEQLPKTDRRGSLPSKSVDYESDSNSKKVGANYDSTVEDMLKSRRLRGARGDAAKKKEEKKSEKKNRRLSVAMLSNIVQSMTTASEPEKPISSQRRASTAM